MFLNSSTTQGANVVPFLSAPSLTEVQITAIERALDTGWSVDRHESFDKNLTLLVSPPSSLDQDAAFYVEADNVGFILSVIQNDELEARGSFGSIEALVMAMKPARCG